jgi:aryl-alcohol dehydrogenase-like predicted oxidoreductase
MLGELLDGRREEFVLATKYNASMNPDDVNSSGNQRKNLVNSLEASLRRLRTERIDLYWVHARDPFTPVEEVMRALDDAVRAGKVLYVGVSNFAAWEIAQANTLAELRGWSPFVATQLHYNLLERSAERELLPMARTFELAVLAWGPLAEGRLTGKYLRGESGRLSVVQQGTAPVEHADAIVREVVAVAEGGGWTPAQVALAWLRSRPGVVLPILGVTRESQLEDNLASLSVQLDDDALQRLDEVSRPDLGYPFELLRQEPFLDQVYGARWRDLEDRRSIVRRSYTGPA